MCSWFGKNVGVMKLLMLFCRWTVKKILATNFVK